MNKKVILILCFAILAFGISAGIYYFKVYHSVKDIVLDCNYVTYNSEQELDNAADIILYGTPVDEFDKRQHVNNYINGDVLSDFYTLTKFNVMKVIKAPQDLKIKKSDIFDVIEPIGVKQDKDGIKILKPDAYESLQLGEKYIIYLKSNGKDGYSIINMNNGKFNVLHDEKQDDQKHIELKKSVIAKKAKLID